MAETEDSQREATRTERQRQRQAEETPTYPVERLLAESDAFFAQPEHVVAGALEFMSGASKKNYTHAEVNDAIQAYLGHEVTAGEEA